MIAYKLFKVRKNGTLGSLFINAAAVLPIDRWMEAEHHPTKGFAVRPGWHCAHQPVAPHLSEKGRAWFTVEVNGIKDFVRPECQGGRWILARSIRIIGPTFPGSGHQLRLDFNN